MDKQIDPVASSKFDFIKQKVPIIVSTRLPYNSAHLRLNDTTNMLAEIRIGVQMGWQGWRG